MTSVPWPCHRIAVQGIELRTGLPGIEPQAGVTVWLWTSLLISLPRFFSRVKNGGVNRTHSPGVKGHGVRVGEGLVITMIVSLTFACEFLYSVFWFCSRSCSEGEIIPSPVLWASGWGHLRFQGRDFITLVPSCQLLGHTQSFQVRENAQRLIFSNRMATT